MTGTNISIEFNHPGFGLEVNFPLPTKGISGLFGPSGSGKTTLIRCLAGLEKPSHAHINVNGSIWQSENIFLPPHKRRLGMVFQDVRLFNHLNVKGNLLFGYKRTPAQDRKINIDDVLKILELTPLLDRRTDQLSGGEAQRVAIGRALLTSPALLLMDEPLVALGEQHKKDILPYLKKLPQNFGIPILYVSHDFSEMASLAQHMICLKDGKIQMQGNLLDVAAALPDVMNRWSPDNIIDGVIHTPGQFTLSDGQIITIPATSSPNRLIINSRDITLLQAPPEYYAADALVRGQITEITKMKDGRNIVCISLAEQKIHVILGERGGGQSWVSTGHDIYMIINRIKPETD